MTIQVYEKCPACDGTGKVKSSIILVDEIEANLHYLIKDQNEKHLNLSVHPYVHAFLVKGFPSVRMKWFFKYRKWMKLKPDSSYHFLEYHFFNKNYDEIML
jgi:ribonuclease G